MRAAKIRMQAGTNSISTQPFASAGQLADPRQRNPERHLGRRAPHITMSKQALDSQGVRDGLKDILLGPAELYEALRARSAASRADDAAGHSTM
jgi:hypothetical protein